MKKTLLLASLLMLLFAILANNQTTAQSVSATYSLGDIPTDAQFISLPGSSTCPGALIVTIPTDAFILSVDVQYNMTALNSGWMVEQTSQLRCVSPGGTNEATLAAGDGYDGTFFYSRTNLDIANNVFGGGDIFFELHAGRKWGGTDCSTTYNKVDNGTWTVTVHYQIAPPNYYSLTMDNPIGLGSVSPEVGAVSHLENWQVNISAQPAVGWAFSQWLGDVADPFSPQTFTIMDGNKTIQAVFTDLGIPAIMLPLVENFDSGIPAGWENTGGRWYSEVTANAGGLAPELRFSEFPYETDIFRLHTPKITTANTDNLELTFRIYLGYIDPAYCTIKVQSSIDGLSWNNEWDFSTDGGIAASEIVVNLNHLIGEEFYIAWVVDGYSYYAIDLFIDNVKFNVTPELDIVADYIFIGDDLSLSDLSASSATYNGEAVSGTFSFDDGTIVPPAGLYVANVTFTPDNLELYDITHGTANVMVYLYEGSISATYTEGDIPTDRDFFSLPGQSNCPGLNSVTIPAGAYITNVDVQYSMTTNSGAWMVEQKSELRCISLGGTNENTLASGDGFGGTFFYSRSNLDIANNVLGGGEIFFELHAGREWDWGEGGCSTNFNKVDNGSWTITVHYQMDPPLQYTLTVLESDGLGQVTPIPGDYIHNENRDIQLNAIPAIGWEFSHWIGNVNNPSAAETFIHMNSNQTVQAVFNDLAIPAIDLPYSQNFTGTPELSIPTGWYRTSENWRATNTANAGGASPEMTFYQEIMTTSAFKIITSKLIASNTSLIELDFIYSTQINETGNLLKVQSSTDGLNWVDEWVHVVNSNQFNQAINLNLTHLANEEFYLAWVMDGYAYNVINVSIDNIILSVQPDIFPIASDIIYGEELAQSNLLSSYAEYDGVLVPGTFEFESPAIIPSDIGIYIANVTFTPDDTENYFPASGSVNVNVLSKELTIGGSFTAFNKEHDGSTFAEIDENNLLLVGVVGADVVDLINVNAEFASPNIADNIIVNIISADINNVDAYKYSVSTASSPTTTANIIPIQQTLHLTIAGGGNVNVDGITYTTPITVDDGTILNLEAITFANYSFLGWSGDIISNNIPETILMDGDKYVTATFTRTYNLSTTVVEGDQLFNIFNVDYKIAAVDSEFYLTAIVWADAADEFNTSLEFGYKNEGEIDYTWSPGMFDAKAGNDLKYSIVLNNMDMLNGNTLFAARVKDDVATDFQFLTPDADPNFVTGDEYRNSDKALRVRFFDYSGSVSEIYNSGDIQSDRDFTTTSGNSTCPGTIAVSIPANAYITNVDVEYNMTAWNSAWIADQTSQLRCVSAGGASEESIATADGLGGTFAYSRSNLDIANNVIGGGDIIFELHAGRYYGGLGCNLDYNFVNNNTWKVTVHYQMNPPAQYTLSMEEPTGLGNVTPNIGGYLYNENREVSVKASPAVGWEFSHWIGDVADIASPETTVLMNNNKTIQAVFVDMGIASLNLPYNEFFDEVLADELPLGWTRTHNNWGVNYNNSAGGDVPEMGFDMDPYITDNFRLYSPKLLSADTDKLSLSLLIAAAANDDNQFIRIKSSADGLNWTDEWAMELILGVFVEQEVEVNLNHLIGQEFYLAWAIDGYSYNYLWAFDNVLLRVAAEIFPVATNIYYGEELAASDLSASTALYDGNNVPGVFSFDDPALTPPIGTHTVNITFTPDDTDSFLSVNGTVVVNVLKAFPIIYEWPTASDITFGQSLASSTLIGGATSVPGIFVFDDESITPFAGVYAAAVTFFPDDDINYETISGSVNVIVNKATPVVNTWPVASDIIYTQSLASSVLSGGSASVPGVFAFSNPLIVPPAGTYIAGVTFTPNDGANFESVTSTVEVIVHQAETIVVEWPTASNITFGESLAFSTLTGGIANTTGVFTFEDDTVEPFAGLFIANVIFTPDDAGFETVFGTVEVFVDKADPIITTWPIASTIVIGQSLASSVLSGGVADVAGQFEFNDATIIPPLGLYNADITFFPTNFENYNEAYGLANVNVIEPPIIAVNPSSFNETLASGDIVTRTLTVYNNGEADLEILITEIDAYKSGTKVSEKLPDYPIVEIKKGHEPQIDINEPVRSRAGGPDEYGYEWTSIDFQWLDSSAGTPVALTDDSFVSGIPLGFSFEYYEIEYTQLNIMSNGWVSFTNSNTWYPSCVPGDGGGIVAFGRDLNPATGGVVRHYSGGVSPFRYFIVEFNNIKSFGSEQATTFQIVFHENKNIIDFNYLSNDMLPVSLGIENSLGTDGMGNCGTGALYIPNTIVNAATSIRFTPPNKWLGLNPVTAVIPGGSHIDIQVEFDATDMFEGVYEKIIMISSNDPVTPLVEVPATLYVTGTPNINLSAASLDFGQVYASINHTLPLSITNNGTAMLEITNISTTNVLFSVLETELSVGPNLANLIVNFSANTAGIFDGFLTFNTNVVGQESISIPLSAEILEHEIILAVNPIEAGTVSGEGLYPQGTEVTINAIPNDNYIFVNWTEGGIVVSEEGSFIFILENDISLVANFALAPTITVNPEFFDENIDAGDIITRTLTINNIGDIGSELIASLSIHNVIKASKTALNPELIESVVTSGSPFNTGNVGLEKLIPSQNINPSTKAANASVLYVNTFDDNDITFKTALQALPNISVFDELNVGAATPNVDYLLGYDIVIVAILDPMANAVLLGNNLAEYVDNGGSVILLQPSLYTGGGFTLAGNIVTADYSPLSIAGYNWTPSICTNFIESPFTESVTSISSNYYSFTSIQGAGVSLGSFDNSYPVAAYNANKNVLAINVIPLEGEWGGDLVKLTENAINKYSSWLSVDNNNATIAGGGSFDVQLTFDATDLIDGVYEQIIRISSNDASNPIVDVPVTLTVTGFPEILVSIDPLDFGVIAIDTEKTLNVVINNTGTADLHISDIATSDASFTASAMDLTIPPKDSAILQVTFVSSVGGVFNADLTFTTNDILNENILIEMLAEVKAPPAITVDPASLYQKLAENESAQQILTITNSGDLPLEFLATYNLSAKEIKKAKLEKTIELGESTIIAENHPDKPAVNVEQCIKYNKGLKADLNVLIYEDAPDFNYYTAALQELGYTYTSVNSWTALYEALIIGVSWDLVIVNSYSYTFENNVLNELNNLINNDKKVVFAHWESIASHPISGSFGINVINSITTPINFSINADYSILTSPNILPDEFSWTHNQYNADGQIVEVVGNAKRLAIYDGYPNSATIVLNESENAIFNAFQSANFSTDSNGSGKIDIQELIENQITFLTKSIVVIEPNIGVILPGESAELIVTFNSEGLGEGIYEGNVTITSNDPVNPEIIVPTVLEVEFIRHTIIATAEPNGSISPVGEVLVIEGADQLFTITPDVGYHVVDVIVDAASIGAVADYTFVNVLENHTIHADFAINTYIATASATAGGTINPLGVTVVEHGSSLTYNIIPDVGYHIVDVIVNAVSQGVIYDYTFENITEDVSIHVIFEINTYNIAIAKNPTEGGNVFGAGFYEHGYNVIATAVANGPDFVFTNWTENGEQVSANPVYEFIATSDRNLVANFGEVGQYNVALFMNPSDAGTLSGGGSYDIDAEVTIEATPIFGFVFEGWTGYSTTTENPFVFTMPSENISFTANFSVATYEIIASAGEFGTIDPSGTIAFEHGDNQTYTFIPDAGYHVDDVLVDGVSVGAVDSYTFNNITDNHSIHASFAIDMFEILASAGPGGSISPEGSNIVEYDSNLSFSITPDEGYMITDVLVDGISQGPIDSYTFEFINDNHTIHAEFEAIDYTLTVLIDPVDVGEVSINPDNEFYNVGETITLIASAFVGYDFLNWTIEGIVISTNATLDYIMPANDVFITANFVANGQYLVSVTVEPNESGYVVGAGSYLPGALVSLEAFAYEGFHFIAWELDGSVVETATTYEFTMPEENVILIARFEAILYDLTVIADPVEGGNVSGSGEYFAGEEINVSASPSYGWEFFNWTVLGVEVSVSEDFIYTMPFENVTLVANFSELPEYSVSVTVDPVEGGTILGEGTYYLGEDVVLTANANIGYTFLGWEEEGSIVETATTYEFVMPNNNVNLVALFEINVHTLTLEANPVDGGTVSGAGEYAYGDIIPVSAVAEVGYNFVYWSVDGNVVSTDANFDYMMPDNDVTLIANFVVEGEYLVVVEIRPEEGGTVTGTGSYLPEAVVTLEATTNAGFLFIGWELEGVIIETQPIYEFVMPENHVYLVAQFEAITYQLTLVADPVEGGELFGAGDYIPGEMISVSAVAAEGYTFVNWSLGIDIISEDADFYYTMPEEDITLVALFEINVHTLTLVANPVGGGTVVGGGDYEYGTSVEVTATPAVDYLFENWTIEGTVISTDATFNFVMPDNDVTLTANFSEVPPVTYTLIVVAKPAEGGSVSGGGNYEEGEEVTVNATPVEGFTFSGWFLEENLLSENQEYIFDMPAENMTLTAVFGIAPGINDNDLVSINIFPNPSKGNFSVESDRIISEIKVINMIGKVVHTESSDSKMVELSLPGLDPGTYFVVVFTEKGQTTLKMQIAK